MKTLEEVISFIISRLNAIIFELEQVKDNKEVYTIEIKDGSGNVIKSFTI